MDDTEVALRRISAHKSSPGWTTLTLQQVKLLTESKSNLTSSLYSACRVRLYKQTPETGLGAEVYHQASLVIDAHAGWVERTWQKISPKKGHFYLLDFKFIGSVLASRNKCEKRSNSDLNLLSHLPWSSACGGLPMPSFHRMAVSYTNVSRSSDCRSKCCQPPVPTGEWNTYDT